MAGSILVPLDGSPFAEQALPLGISLAQRFGSSLLLMQAIPTPGAPRYLSGGAVGPMELQALFRDAAEEYLETVQARVQQELPEVETLVVEGPAGEAIARVADEEPITHVVMTTHGRTGLSRWTLGSVADRLRHLVHRPLLVVRPQGETGDEPPVPVAFKHIVVPLDGSPLAERVLPQAAEFARTYQAEIHLFRAISSWPPSLVGAEAAAFEMSWYEALREEAQHYLEQVAMPLRAAGLSVHQEVGAEPAADGILEYADRVEADLIAMTTHAREGLSRLVLGSVTDRVVRAGEAPVLVVR